MMDPGWRKKIPVRDPGLTSRMRNIDLLNLHLFLAVLLQPWCHTLVKLSIYTNFFPLGSDFRDLCAGAGKISRQTPPYLWWEETWRNNGTFKEIIQIYHICTVRCEAVLMIVSMPLSVQCTYIHYDNCAAVIEDWEFYQPQLWRTFINGCEKRLLIDSSSNYAVRKYLKLHIRWFFRSLHLIQDRKKGS